MKARTQKPEALRLTEMLKANEWPGHVTLVSYVQECVAELLRQHARIAELEKDAARYRFLRDTCWSSNKELATVISLQMNKVWDEKIDEAMARNKKSN